MNMAYDLIIFILAFVSGICFGFFLIKSLHASLQNIESHIKQLVSVLQSKK